MGEVERVGEFFRQRLRAEREHRGWSQLQLSQQMNVRGLGFSSTTLAKIENGDRKPKIEELVGFADVFGMSVDALIGHASSSTDLAWAAGKLSRNAHRSAVSVSEIGQQVVDELQDVRHYAQYSPQTVDSLIALSTEACEKLRDARDALAAIGDQFPLLGQR